MNLEFRLRHNACLVAVLGMLVFGLAEMNPAWLLFIVAAGVLAGIMERRDAIWSIGPTGLNLILLGAVGFAAVDYFLFASGWIVSLAHFLILVQTAKLLLPKSSRDLGQMYLVSLMIVAVAAVVAADVLFAVALVLYSAAVLRGLILYHFQRELAEATQVYLPDTEETARPTSNPEMRRVLSRRFLATLTTVIVAAWLTNALFFMLVPRLPTRLFNLAPAGWFQRLTGFSESVRLGEIGRVLENNDAVMHVTLEDGRGTRLRGERNLYFRGMTFQHYDGRDWQRLGPALDGVNIYVSDGPDGRLPHPQPSRDDFSRPDVVFQDIRLEPARTSALFALQGVLPDPDPPRSRLQFQPVYLDQTWQALTRFDAPVRYHAWSIADPADRLYPPAMMTREGLPPRPVVLPERFRNAYLQLPDKLAPRVVELARSVAGVDDGADPLDRARRLETYLRTKLAYTLDLRPNPDVEPVEDFLFNTKRGHCEYFASSLVILLRAADVPARLVTGFHGGEWNEVGEWYLVKQSDAHAWVEAWIDRQGWTRFDPTPAAERTARAATLAMGPVGRWLDYFRSSWMNYVVEYDQEQQSAVFRTTRQATRRIRESVSGALNHLAAFLQAGWSMLTDLKRLSTTEGAMIFGGTLAASTALVLTARWVLLKLLRALRAEYSRRRARRLGRVHVAFYQELLRELKRRGFLRDPHETPLEFAESLAPSYGPAQPSIREVTDAYYRVRFGGAELPSDEEKRLRALVEALRKAPLCRS